MLHKTQKIIDSPENKPALTVTDKLTKAQRLSRIAFLVAELLNELSNRITDKRFKGRDLEDASLTPIKNFFRRHRETH
jgi:hypothetical protein